MRFALLLPIIHLTLSALLFPALVSSDEPDGVRQELSGSSLERDYERDWSDPERSRYERRQDYDDALAREYQNQSGSSFERDSLTKEETLQGCTRIVVVNGQRRCLIEPGMGIR